MGILALAGCSDSDEAKKVRIGETATVDADKGGKIDVTVVAVEAGSDADLATLANPAKYVGKTPYYLRYRLTKTGDKGDSSTKFVVSAGDHRLTSLHVAPSFEHSVNPDDAKNPVSVDVRTFEKCTDKGQMSIDDFAKAPKGTTYQGCTIYLSNAGEGAPSRVEWVPDKDAVVVWK
ncbi:hypothetical protein B4N89_00860 [Embleya scabrispora]|uniref:Uncharacterized protein n=1 Tax=Embleya scabrispora TaxID=159449 RepID=A0A1T3NSA2_9ACTN|nr:hypothetical protein B4N89_00860 [Embleya scabrispora]